MKIATGVYIYSTRQKKLLNLLKWPHSKVYTPLSLNTMCHFLDDPRLFLYLVMVVHESLVGPEQLNCCSSEKSSSFCTFFGFPASSAYLNPFKQWLYDFEIHIFTPRTIEGLIHNYYKRWKHVLMLKKATQCIKSRGMNTFEQDDDDDDV